MSALRAALPTSSGHSSFIDDYMSLEMSKTYEEAPTTLTFRSRCVEAPHEAASTALETALKLECNISIATNFLMSGIMDVCTRKGRIH